MSGNQIFTGEKRRKSVKRVQNLHTSTNIQLGFVRETGDPQRMGRLRVWVPELGPDEDGSWLTVSYASPFAGVTNIEDVKTDSEAEADTQKSYGFWAVPPDVGNQVLVCFVNGDPGRGFWFGCVYQQNMNHMVPGIGYNKSTDDEMNEKFSPFAPPVVEYNKKDTDLDPKKPERPVRSKLAEGLITQGLNKEGERGVSNSSARRENTSKVFGWLTPAGNSLVYDDDEANSYIRFRTTSGTQIMVSETSGFIYMITKGGKSWMEISDGAVEIFSEAPISIRSKDDINIRADKDLNLDAGGDVNIHAGGALRTFSGDATNMAAGGDFVTQAGGKGSHGAGSDMAIGAGGDLGMTGSGNVVVDAGGDNVRNGAQILDNSGGGSAVTPDDAQFKEATSVGNEGEPPTIVSRLPGHEPYEHPINATDSGGDDGGFGGGGNGEGQVKDSEGNVVTGPVTPDNTPVRNIAGFKVSDKVNGCIMKASQRTGVPYANLMALVAQESAFKANAGAKTSSAKGLFQFTDGTWRETYRRYGPNGTVVKNPTVRNDVFDACSNAMLGAYFYKENVAALSRSGLSSGPTDAYFVHFLGSGGGPKFLRAVKSNPNGPSTSSVGASQARANRNVFYKSNGQVRTNREVYNLFNAKVGATVPQWDRYRRSQTNSNT